MSLAGRTVWITRPREDAEALGSLLTARGARPRYLPCIRRAPPTAPEKLAPAWAEVDAMDRVLVGSVAAVEPFLALPPPPEPAAAACVGAATAGRLSHPRCRRHFKLAEVAEVRRAEGLVAALTAALGEGGRLEGRRFLFPRAPEGRRTLGLALRDLGAEVQELETYRIACVEAPLPPSERPGPGDVLTFLSGRTLDCFLQRLGPEDAYRRLRESVVAVIGPVASARAAALGVRVDVMPRDASTEALVGALEAKLG